MYKVQITVQCLCSFLNGKKSFGGDNALRFSWILTRGSVLACDGTVLFYLTSIFRLDLNP